MKQTFGQFLTDSAETIFNKSPVENNCFYRLKNGLVNKISIHTTTLTQFLKEHQKNDLNKFILLDHMDWLVNQTNILSEEWQQIIENSNQNSTFIWRTLSYNSKFVDDTQSSIKEIKLN